MNCSKHGLALSCHVNRMLGLKTCFERESRIKNCNELFAVMP